MSGRNITTLLSAVAAAALLNVAGASAQTNAAITGLVSSAQEGAMEGVLVTAKKDGSTISTTVVTDEKGRKREYGKGTLTVTDLSYGSKLVRVSVTWKSVTGKSESVSTGTILGGYRS